MKKFLSIFLAFLMCLAFTACNIVEPTEPDEPDEPETPNSKVLTYVSFRINPEVEVLIDETDTVVAANAINADGEVVLSTIELEGKAVDDAAEAFTEAAVDLGYMDGKDTVNVDVQGENTEVVKKVENKITDKLMKFFEKKGITGKVSKEVLDTYLAKAEEFDITPGHAKIIARVLEANPELTYDELLDLTVKELLELLKTTDNKVTADLKGNYKEAVEALRAEYAELFHLREVIEDLEDDLDDEDDLTTEEAAKLKADLVEAKKKAEALEKEFKEKLDALKAEFKVSSEKAREEHKKEADERKQAKKDGKDFEDDDDRDDKKPADKNQKPERDDEDDDDNRKKPERDED